MKTLLTLTTVLIAVLGFKVYMLSVELKETNNQLTERTAQVVEVLEELSVLASADDPYFYQHVYWEEFSYDQPKVGRFFLAYNKAWVSDNNPEGVKMAFMTEDAVVYPTLPEDKFHRISQLVGTTDLPAQSQWAKTVRSKGYRIEEFPVSWRYPFIDVSQRGYSKGS